MATISVRAKKTPSLVSRVFLIRLLLLKWLLRVAV
jgi:hypothetical protein